MFADTFKVTEVLNGILYEVEGKTVTRTEGFDDSLISANASADETPEGTDDTSVSGVDIVLNHKLQETAFKKDSYKQYVKEYMKAVKAHLEANNPERVKPFMEGVPAAVKSILENFKNFQFFTGESMNPDGTVALLNYREDGITPYMIFFKDGLIVEKC